jgi:prevent-host-death family protein
MRQVVSMVEAKSRLAELVGQVKFGGRQYILERRGRPMAMLISVEEYEQLRAQGAATAESLVSPLSPELQRRQATLVARAQELRAQYGPPEDRLADLLTDLPPVDHEFWLEMDHDAC